MEDTLKLPTKFGLSAPARRLILFIGGPTLILLTLFHFLSGFSQTQLIWYGIEAGAFIVVMYILGFLSTLSDKDIFMKTRSMTADWEAGEQKEIATFRSVIERNFSPQDLRVEKEDWLLQASFTDNGQPVTIVQIGDGYFRKIELE